MGSTNRDYMRDDPDSRTPTWGHDVPTTKWLLIVTVGMFFLQTVLTQNVEFGDLPGQRFISNSYVERWFSLSPNQVLQGQIWRLVTFAFCHDRHSPFALVFNMVALWYLGSVLERMYGSREFLWFYLMSAFTCGLVFTAFGLKMLLPVPLMGASACVLSMLALYATHFPRQEILFCWVIPMQIRVLLLIYVAVDVYQILQAYAGQGPWIKVAYMSELWGAAFGYFYRMQKLRLSAIEDYLNLAQWRRSIRQTTTSRTLKVFHPESNANLYEQVDAILAKIHEHGSESLTERERAILQRASDQAKHRL